MFKWHCSADYKSFYIWINYIIFNNKSIYLNALYGISQCKPCLSLNNKDLYLFIDILLLLIYIYKTLSHLILEHLSRQNVYSNNTF